MANCRGCNAPILWALDGASRCPLDPKPSTAGNVLVWRVPDGTQPVPSGTLACATFAGQTLADLVAHGVPLRTSHFATCPVADRFKATA